MPEEVLEQVEVKVENVNPFANQSWSDTAAEKPVEAKQEVVDDKKPAEEKPAEVVNEEIIEPKEWLKREFQVDDPEVLKQQIKEYNELKAKQPEPLKFENEVSEKIFNLLKEGKPEGLKTVAEFLKQQERLEQFTTAEITKDNASDIIKMGMRLKHPDLTESEIEYKYNKQFGLPKAPVQLADELEEEFEQRKQEWEERVREVEMEKTIEAKMYKPELANAKTKLVLPEIQKPQVKNEPSQEELDRLTKLQESFAKEVDAKYNSFEGFTVNYKDEDVEFPVSFTYDDAAKKALAEELKTFDVDGFIAERWFGKDGSPNVKVTMEDIALLKNKEAVFQKLVNETAAQVRKQIMKIKSNIDIGSGGKTDDLQNGNRKALNPFDTSNWSDKPVPVN